MGDNRDRQEPHNLCRGRRIGALLAAFPAVALMAVPAHAVTVRTGTVDATITVTFTPAPPAKSTVSCTISLIGSDTNAPSDSRFVEANVVGSRASCRVIVPYRWNLAVATSKMTIAYSVSGPAQSSSGIYRVLPIPANGITTKAAITVSQ